ncbi:hypothetical protein A3F08_01390 [Candidatus Berkelbacteria bacterium RIFCSPHIGHO2_12_FULL_36_9]|uniref:Pseudouridine synthase RsuA/RluA-like domain-containing protein n=1 Tax=Candidatus Berkelbacteria bacterium RIFCSPHIGHO2_12_FULL_36_9 TaxID=1797469 RepID=A0A1F5EKE1_9BACT|nr:MAG: hypothetical protein A3F08_01390 [Candidatus Berkelbacteria bacterium RIFCSPHIGHO2_12_FULL_36_9]
MNKIKFDPKIIYENQDFLVVDKPAGLIAHPTSPIRLRSGLPGTNPEKETEKTLVEWLLEKYPEVKKYIKCHSEAKPKNLTRSFANAQDDVNTHWPDPTRPGIVHRLDKDTSGLLLVAKNPKTLNFFQDQFRNRVTEKTYLALVLGKVEPKEGIIKGMIGRDQNNKTKQHSTFFDLSWNKGKTRPAETLYRVLKYYESYQNNIRVSPRNHPRESAKSVLTLLEVKPKTGRMHQVRVHLKQDGWPIIGDQVYNTKESKKVSDVLDLHRQFLHAHKLKIKIPSGEIKEFLCDPPNDLNHILGHLK